MKEHKIERARKARTCLVATNHSVCTGRLKRGKRSPVPTPIKYFESLHHNY